MAWGRLDDKFHRNRKVRDLRKLRGGKEALGVWLFWWSWCLDDPSMAGEVPYEELETAKDLRAAQMLVEAGLWETKGSVFKFHDFHVYNPTPVQKEAQRKAHAESQAKYRGSQKSGGSDSQVINHATREVINHASEGVINQPSHVHARSPDGSGLGSVFSETDRVEPWQVQDAINAARVAAGMSGILQLSQPEQAALAGYCRLHAGKSDLMGFAVASHMAWSGTPDAAGKYGNQSPIGAWLRKPDDAILRATTVQPKREHKSHFCE